MFDQQNIKSMNPMVCKERHTENIGRLASIMFLELYPKPLVELLVDNRVPICEISHKLRGIIQLRRDLGICEGRMQLLVAVKPVPSPFLFRQKLDLHIGA